MELTENQKRFVRIIKEIGLWHIWCKERKERLRYRKGHYMSIIVPFIPNFTHFSSVINNSFVWAGTNNPQLWPSIHEFAKPYTSEEILKSEIILNGIKKYVKTLC